MRTLNIPDNLELNDTDLSVYIATKLYEDGKLSAG